jgi:SWI/SNF-related matrix-associated actin-dependent regulator of chromatin subfamily A-like protein 1
MTIQRVGDRWTCNSRYEDRHIPREAGFRWDAGTRLWFTSDPIIAARLMTPAQAAAAKAEAEAKFRLRRESVIQSIAEETDFHVPTRNGLVMRNYQRVGVEWSCKRTGTLNADHPGLGKTIQFCGVVNVLEAEIRKALVVCPNSLRLNWLREMQKWLVKPWRIAVWNSEVCRPAYVEISIIHYDAVHKWSDALRSVDWDIICLDECHLLKNPGARRTRAIFGIDLATAKKEEGKRLDKLSTYLPGAPVPRDLLRPIEVVPPLRGRRSVAMTGTPLPNRPKEVFSILHYLDPVTFKSRTKFQNEFCDAHYNEYGTDAQGASNLGRLQTLLRSTVMIRRRKQDVLKELPAKQRTVIEIPHDATEAVAAELEAYKKREADLESMRQAVAAAKEKASEDPEVYAAAVRGLRQATRIVFQEISKLRLEAARAKLPYVIDHLRGLAEGGEKLIVFAHHQEIIRAIAGEFGRHCVTCYGPDDGSQRQRNVDRFQADPDCWVIAGNYDVMGVGWTLTASWHVVAAELDWVPGRMTQAEDRAHRMGQVNAVLVEHLVLEGSLDAHMARIVVEKQEVQAQALDMDVPVGMPRTSQVVAPAAPPSAEGTARATPAPRPLLPPPTRQIGEAEQLSLLDADSW